MSVDLTMQDHPKQWCVYMVQCSDESIYTGITNNIAERVAAHNAGKGAKYTRSRLPVFPIWVKYVPNKSEAAKLEAKIKKMKRDQKIALIDDPHLIEGYE